MANGYSINWKKLEVNQDNEGTPVHPLVALMFSAAVGGVFVVFLPFIGLYMAGGFLLQKLGLELGSLFRSNIAPQAVGVAYLTGSPTKKDSSPGSSLNAIETEITSRRSNK